MGTLVVPYHIGERVAGFPVPDGANVVTPPLSGDTPQDRMIALFRDLAARVAAEEEPLVYAGDCMAPLGVLAGLHRRGVSPFILWLDAHGDFNTWETTPSGYIGGMPLAMLAGFGEQTIVRGLDLSTVDASRILLSDARDVDPEEQVQLEKARVPIVGVDRILERVPADQPIFVHLDVDVVTPREMPALRFPAEGGPTVAQVEAMLCQVVGARRVVATTVACTWDPATPAARAAEAATARLVLCLKPARAIRPASAPAASGT